MVDYIICNDLSEISLDENKPVFCDIETDGLYTDVRLVQLYQEGNVYILDTDILNLDDIKDFIKPLHTVWYNASYDLGTLNMCTSKIDDLFYLVRLAYPKFNTSTGYALDKVLAKLDLHDLYKDIDKKTMQKAGYVKGAYISHEQYTYAALDVYVLSLLWTNKIIKMHIDNQSYKLDILSLRYAIKYQQNGIPVNKQALDIELKKANNQRKELQEKLGDLNANSPKQCSIALGVKSTNAKVLAKLISEGNELAVLIRQQRKVIKRIGFLNSWNFDKIYTKFNVAGAITGRFTSTGGDLEDHVNVQQINRDLQYIFSNSKDSDYIILKADYSTLEIRLACCIFADRYMYKQLMNNEDLHTSMARLITGKNEISKEERTNAKAVNFGYLFGMSSTTFKEYALESYNIVFTQDECDKLRKDYFKMYPDIKKYHNRVWEKYTDNAFTYKTALGRIVKPKLGTDGINGPVQGTGAECTKLAIHYMVKENNKVLDYIINVVHDAIYINVPIVEREYWGELLTNSMLKSWKNISQQSLFFYKDVGIEAEIEEVKYKIKD